MQAQVGDKAPAFSLKDNEGKTFSSESLKGKVVVLNFWATWCPPCRAEIPAFKNVYEKYKDKGVEILGVSLDHKGWGVITPFVTKYKINYPVVLGGGGNRKGLRERPLHPDNVHHRSQRYRRRQSCRCDERTGTDTILRKVSLIRRNSSE
jgi:thiol-disulfide isomerase/thioredoxin